MVRYWASDAYELALLVAMPRCYLREYIGEGNGKILVVVRVLRADLVNAVDRSAGGVDHVYLTIDGMMINIWQ